MLLASYSLVACNNGNDTINEVPVIHARILSTQDNGCELMIKTDKDIMAELETYTYYECPGLEKGEFIVLERWNADEYVYKGTVKDKEYDFKYRERNWRRDLSD